MKHRFVRRLYCAAEIVERAALERRCSAFEGLLGAGIGFFSAVGPRIPAAGSAREAIEGLASAADGWVATGAARKIPSKPE